ncbi:hypothetical protein Bbelb_343670 [Branchiostoma belcheri]|nr:hypothetical protein Bbelb_343670 [Branchiostoma belcheri]
MPPDTPSRGDCSLIQVSTIYKDALREWLLTGSLVPGDISRQEYRRVECCRPICFFCSRAHAILLSDEESTYEAGEKNEKALKGHASAPSIYRDKKEYKVAYREMQLTPKAKNYVLKKQKGLLKEVRHLLQEQAKYGEAVRPIYRQCERSQSNTILILMAAAKAIVLRRDHSLLTEYGSHIEIK